LAVLLPREGGLWWGKIFWLHLPTASAQCLRLSERFFISGCDSEKYRSTETNGIAMKKALRGDANISNIARWL